MACKRCTYTTPDCPTGLEILRAWDSLYNRLVAPNVTADEEKDILGQMQLKATEYAYHREGYKDNAKRQAEDPADRVVRQREHL